jgi:hypothetical protein
MASDSKCDEALVNIPRASSAPESSRRTCSSQTSSPPVDGTVSSGRQSSSRGKRKKPSSVTRAVEHSTSPPSSKSKVERVKNVSKRVSRRNTTTSTVKPSSSNGRQPLRTVNSATGNVPSPVAPVRTPRKRKSSNSSCSLPPPKVRRVQIEKNVLGPVIPQEGPSTWIEGKRYGIIREPHALQRFRSFLEKDATAASDPVNGALSSALDKMSSTTLSHLVPGTINSMFL